MRLIDEREWEKLYSELTKGLEPYDHYDNGFEDAVDRIDDWMDVQPTVDAEPVKHGRWKGAGMGDYTCSLCMETVSGNSYNYCPNCGAKMDGEAE